MRTKERVKYKKDLLFERQVLNDEYDDFFEEVSLEDTDLDEEMDEEDCFNPDEDDVFDEGEKDDGEIGDPIFEALKRAEMNFGEDGEFQYADGFREEEY